MASTKPARSTPSIAPSHIYLLTHSLTLSLSLSPSLPSFYANLGKRTGRGRYFEAHTLAKERKRRGEERRVFRGATVPQHVGLGLRV
jgi:hypothetical protein